MPTTHWILTFQITAMWAVLVWYFRFLGARIGRPPIHEFGILWPLILLLYSTTPVMTWLAEGGEYPFYYGRLALLDPDPEHHIEILNVAIAYLTSFVAFNYFCLDKKLIKVAEVPPLIPLHIFKIAGCLYIFSIGFELLLKGTGLIRSASDYADAYLAVAELPAGIGQIYKLSSALGNFSVGVIILAALQNYRKYKWVIWGYLLVLMLSYDVSGHRSGIATGLFRVFICWHVAVRAFSTRTIVLLGIFGLIVFNALGFYRGLMEGAEAQFGLGVSEFLMVYGNAIEMLQHVQNGAVDLPGNIRFAEFISFLPSQIIGSEKNSLDNWFAETYHTVYFNSGGGLAFGSLPQAIVGGGVYEAFIRGAILGAIFAALSNTMRRRPELWWIFPVQLFLIVYLYYSIRSSSFSFIGSIFQVLIPSVIVLHIAGLIFSKQRQEPAGSQGQT